MAKRYDPILCMLVDEPTKAQDAMPSDLKKAGYEVGTVEKYGSTYYTLVYNGKVISTSPTEVNIVEKAKKHYANRHGKAQDVASATQRYINTIVDESKANAEKFVRQAEQDDEVPENELKYVYKAYNEKFGYKFHDSASALDEAIKTADGATGDKLYADVKAIYSLFSNILLTYSNEQSVQKLANEGTKKCLELAAKVKGVRDEAIKACDAVEVETSKWSFSSGKSKPSGFGNWWFKIGTEEKNFSGNWSSAKAEAIKYAKEKGISRISLMT